MILSGLGGQYSVVGVTVCHSVHIIFLFHRNSLCTIGYAQSKMENPF